MMTSCQVPPGGLLKLAALKEKKGTSFAYQSENQSNVWIENKKNALPEFLTEETKRNQYWRQGMI